MQFNFGSIALICLFFASGISCNLYVLDKYEQNAEPIEVIAEHLCNPKESDYEQISRVSTIVRLIDYFASLDRRHPLSACYGRIMLPIHLLHGIVTKSNENVCSETKLAMIEDYHTKYVTTNKDIVEERLNSGYSQIHAPNMLNLFFMHYSMAVSGVCKRFLINNLDWDIKEKVIIKDGLLDEVNPLFGQLFKGSMEQLTNFLAVQDYDDVILMWDLIDGSYMQKKEHIGLDQEEVQAKMFVKVDDLRPIVKMKEDCNNKFKPIYDKLIIPIIRLADMGFSNQSQVLDIERAALKDDQNVKFWFEVTQICEAILPIEFLYDPSVPEHQLVLINKDEARELKERIEQPKPETSEEIQPIQYEPTTYTMVGVDKLDSVMSESGQKVVQRIDSNKSARSRTVLRVAKRLARNILEFAKNKVRNVFISVPVDQCEKTIDSKPKCESTSKNVDFLDVASETIGTPEEIALLGLEGAAKNKKQGIQRMKGRKREGDIDVERQMRAETLQYMHTKSWTDIFSLANPILEAIMPSRKALLLFGLIAIFFMAMISGMLLMHTFAAAG